MANTATTMPGEERLSKRNLWGYSMGGIGRDMVYQLVNTALITYIYVSKNLTPAQAFAITMIFLGCRIFDGCNDPLMGAIIEKTRTRFGKFKPWMMIGMITNIAVIFGLFFCPLTGKEYVIFFAFFYLLWGITYTMNDISYWGMMPSLSSNPTDRNNLSTLANIGAGLGAGIAIGATSLFGYGDLANSIFGGAIKAYRVICVVICVFFAACQTMTFFVVKEKPLPPIDKNAPKEKGTGLMKIFKVIFHNDQLLAIAGSMLCYNVGALVLNLFATYWVWVRFGYQGTLVTIFSLLTACSAVVIIIYPILAKKFTRKKIITLSFITVCLGYGLMLILGLTTGAFLGRGSSADSICFYFIAICGTIAFFGQTLFYQVQTISIANTVEYNEYKTGSRDEGAIFAVRPFMAKMASALGVGIQGVGLLAVGFYSISQDISAQENLVYQGATTSEDAAGIIGNMLQGVDPVVSQWMLVFMTVIPMLFIIAAYIIFMKKFNIDEVKYEEICNTIAARKAAAENAEDVEIADEVAEDAVVEDAIVENSDAEEVFEDVEVENTDAPAEE